MKLDPRIKSLSDILTPFDMERAKAFIGQKGYFAADLECFENLGGCADGVLVNVSDNLLHHYYNPYLTEDNSFSYFIPEGCLNQEGKKYRPFTPEEFCTMFCAGLPVKFRKKDDPESQQDLIMQGIWFSPRGGKTVIYARMGSHLYSFDELLDNFEWRGLHGKDFEPFGVEVEE